MTVNLLLNAIKYTPANGTIEVKASNDEKNVSVEITDTGIGIPKEDLRHIAQPFHRGRNAETIPGTGLGLSIAQRAVELHGGVLTIDSEEGQGTLVAVAIPLRPQKNPAATPA